MAASLSVIPQATRTYSMSVAYSTTLGQPVSLILARLQTATPPSCPSGCSIPHPLPPKHSDYYHAQHLLRVMFQTQRIRSRALKSNLPEYFERSNAESDLDKDRDSDFSNNGTNSSEDEYDEDEGGDRQSPIPQHGSPSMHSVVIPMEDQTLRQAPSGDQRRQQQPSNTGSEQRKAKIPRYVHSLIQNRALRNPLTNMEVEGDPTFFLVLEPGHGGWWYEPWAMATRPIGMEGLSHHQHQPRSSAAEPSEEKPVERPVEKTPEMIQHEKELRKEKWRQSRIVNLEIEAQHELEWRRWRRSLLAKKASSRRGDAKATTRAMRFKLGRDISLLEPSERGLRLPKRVRNESYKDNNERKESSEGKSENTKDIKSECRRIGCEDVELSDNHQQQELQQLNDPAALEPVEQRGERSRAHRRSRHRARIPWWDPDPQPFKMPSTKLSPFAISTLPEPVAKYFGGTSIYSRPSKPKSKSKQQPDQVQVANVNKDIESCQESDTKVSAATSEENNRKQEGAVPLNSNTNGCKWISVQPGDRVAVMIGTGKDFLLFPSFQRLLFRHLSCEDFEDKAGRVGIIPCPISTVVMDRYRAPPNGRNNSDSGSETRPQGSEPVHSERLVSGQSMGQEEFNRRRPWLRWIPGRNSNSPDVPVATTETAASTQRDTSSLEPPNNNVENGLSHHQQDLDCQVLGEKSTKENSTNCDLPVSVDDDSNGLKSEKGLVAIKLQERPSKTVEKSNEDRRRRRELYAQTYEREDYDSSDYSYPSSGEEEEDMSFFHSNGILDFSGSDDSGSDGYDDDEHQETNDTRISSWTLRDWACHIFCCRRPRRSGTALIERSRQDLRRERRRRRRIEQWRLYQQQQRQLQQEQESLAMLRHLPQRIQQVMEPGDVYRCCQVAEFCRFYLTILIAIALMGAIVYGAIQAESSPKSVGKGSGAVQRHKPEHASISIAAPISTVTSVGKDVLSSSRLELDRDMGFLGRGVNRILSQEEFELSGREVKAKVQPRGLKEGKEEKRKYHHPHQHHRSGRQIVAREEKPK
ncbi:hypothetical protein BGZ49_002932 [Haplosporangium sp. Z 27]|nr:hypothetical protein BGZ49_002932 [Haplosporangium sp. Z 27]